MTIEEVAHKQQTTNGNARRYCTRGLNGHILKSFKGKKSLYIDPADFAAWRIACGFDKPEKPPKAPKTPKTLLIRSQQTNDLGVPVLVVQPNPAPESPQFTSDEVFDKAVEKTFKLLDTLPVEQWPPDIEDWLSEDGIRVMERGRLEWLQPANPAGPASNQPDANSSTMPSPASMAKFNRAGAIISNWKAKHSPRPRRQARGWFVPQYSR